MASSNTLEQAIANWRCDTVAELDKRFAQMLDKAIPSLMDLAEKARNNQLQTAYFQAQQEVRRNRDGLTKRFSGAAAARLAELPRPRTDTEAGSEDELQLVNPDIFERQVVLQNVCDRATQRYVGVLHELGHRLSVVHRGSVLGYDDIPASPAQLLQCFDAATEVLDIERVARQALAIVFDHMVLHHMGPRYDALNDMLRDAGVLPNLKYQVSKQESGPTAKPSAETDAETDTEQAPAAAPADTPSQMPPSQPAPDPVVDRIRELMPASPDAGTGQALPATEIADRIHAQHELLIELLPDYGVFAQAPSSLPISDKQLEATQEAMQAQRRAIKTAIGPAHLSRYDESTLDIVGALFESMLGEADLPPHIKVLIGHLHEPYLKLALREAELLSNTGHPARQLLDEMVQAGEQWGEIRDLGSSVFPILQEIVETLRHADTLDRSQLERQRAVLTQRIGGLRKLRDVRSHRTTEAEVGRAKLDQAKDLAEETVHGLIEHQQPSAACQEFLLGPWVDYLTLLLLRNNGQPHGVAWTTGQKLGDELAILSRAVSEPYPPSHEDLTRLHRQLVNTLGQLVPHYQPRIDALMQGLKTLLDQDRDVAAEQQAPAPPLPERRKRLQDQADEASLTPDEAALVAELVETPSGTRFRLPGKHGGPARLVTMTWCNPKTRRLLFVDQSGVKSDLLAAADLARLMRKGLAQRVESERPPFFTRALNTLRHYLEKSGLIKHGQAHD